MPLGGHGGSFTAPWGPIWGSIPLGGMVGVICPWGGLSGVTMLLGHSVGNMPVGGIFGGQFLLLWF